MSLQVTTVMLAVEDLSRAKKFYWDGMGCANDKDFPQFVSFNMGDGSSSLALYRREAAAQDAGVSAEGSGFRGFSFHYIVSSDDPVDEMISNAAAGGGTVVKPPQQHSGRVLRILQRPRWSSVEGRRRPIVKPAGELAADTSTGP